MPVRSLSSFVLRWPDKQTVDMAVRAWTKGIVEKRKDVLSDAGSSMGLSKGDMIRFCGISLYSSLQLETNCILPLISISLM